MFVFAASDKGGTGRSVTSSNIVYRRALQGDDVCYLDFDFGSPTAGAILNIPGVAHGTKDGGLHHYLAGTVPEPQQVDFWAESEQSTVRARPPGAGRLVLLPGDNGGGEFPTTPDLVHRCRDLFLRLYEEFDVILVDLSAGRSYATDIVLAVTALPELRDSVCRWLVFHRWTRQHIIAASGLVFGDHGIIEAGMLRRHDRGKLANAIRFVRTAVVDPNSVELAGLRAAQVSWLHACDQDLRELASQRGVGRTALLGSVPLDPVLQWREQLISDADVYGSQIANQETVEAFDLLAKRLSYDDVWEGL